MASYFLAPALVQLREEINEMFPKRDKSSDGWIGDASHSARKSEHNPCWTCTGNLHGIVRAIDVDIDDNDSSQDLRKMILEVAIGDPRVWYVISNGIIYSRTRNWVAKRYTGSNGHFHHVHISLRETGNFDTQAWFGPVVPKVTPGTVNLENMVEQFRAFRKLPGSEDVEIQPLNGMKRIQDSLNRKYNANLTVDGIIGEKTAQAYALHEKTRGGTGRSGIPDATSLPSLIGPEYGMTV